ncbi:MAG: hypothetical protein WBC62_06545 [Candidatus Macondimonas sp.]
MHSLRESIDEGIPIVGLEPSCVAVFRDELPNLFPDSEVAHRLHVQTYTLAEYLEQKTDWKPPKYDAKALIHAHCHHKSVLTTQPDRNVLDAMGLDYKWLDSGCCGMAGSFGFDRHKYSVSIDVGELVLLPAVRETDAETLVITDGFSCREQIAQTTDRKALHLAEVMALALDANAAGHIA